MCFHSVLVFALQLNMKIPDDNIPNPVSDDDVIQRQNDKTKEFMNPRKEPGDFSAHIFKNKDHQTTSVQEKEGETSADVQVRCTRVELHRWDKLNSH